MKRLKIVDAYRGFALINMIAYHGFYDLVNLLAMPLLWFSDTGAYIWQQLIVFSFVLVSGLVLNYAKHPRKRGMVLCLWGFVLTACTYIFVPQELITFGILSFLGSAMLITSLLKKNKHADIISFFCFLGFLFTQELQKGYWGFYGIHLAKLQFVFPDNILFFILGMPGTRYYSSDYAPLFPWIFIFWLGFFGWQVVEHKFAITSILMKSENEGNFDRFNSLAFLGRNTLLIYLLHQPILYFLLRSL